ncbi:MAG: YegS/Rv2252/BmrU family lipid kinase [Lachnospiraceae bacterium]|uniref:diacylglycerol/lipid kinase family protein n=1 Tax=Candidatus Merdisoma sp. JLR.KK006 TaxID=3112626 RepID=UPI002FF12E97|nr:YegS/Rv2252/BmrU family lipid kinase [Lachnospiraceae bacterium]
MEWPKKKLYFIYNPHAGKEHIKGKLYGILQVMADAGYELTVYPTKGAQDAVDQLIQMPEGYDLVVCSGGDGTLDEVVTGMMQREEKLPIGYIPAGTCNDFARSLKIPVNMAEAAQIAVQGQNFLCDVGSFNDKHFIYIAAFGIFTDVSYSTKQEVKNVLGQMAYILEGMKSIYNVKSYQLKVTSEEMSFEGDFLFGMVTNSKSVGGFKGIVGKDVVFDDGVYEVTFIRRPRNPMELQEILAALLVKEIDSKYMYSFRSARIEVEAQEPIPWTLDGEFGGEHAHAVISNNPRAVEIRVTEECRKSISCRQ